MRQRQWLETRLEELDQEGLRRRPDGGAARAAALAAAEALGRELLDVSSNDYLGLGAELVSRETVFSLLPARTGASASRLLHGTRAEHLELERQLAAWTGAEQSLLFTSGYALNTSALPALAGRGAIVFSDALNHASIVDGCRLSRATVHVYPHLDLAALERLLQANPGDPRLVVTESYFSMDGDGPDLLRLRDLCDRYDAWLYVDEAHALGVFGPDGAGLCAAAGVRADVLVGTLGKAVGTQGSFVAGSGALHDWLWNKARGFVFSTAMSPLLAALTSLQVQRVRGATERRALLQRAAERFRAALAARSIPCLPSFGPIVPVSVADPRAALSAAQQLARRGILAQAVRPPTVPSSRLRLTLHAGLFEGDLEYLADSLAQVLQP